MQTTPAEHIQHKYTYVPYQQHIPQEHLQINYQQRAVNTTTGKKEHSGRRRYRNGVTETPVQQLALTFSVTQQNQAIVLRIGDLELVGYHGTCKQSVISQITAEPFE